MLLLCAFKCEREKLSLSLGIEWQAHLHTHIHICAHVCVSFKCLLISTISNCKKINDNKALNFGNGNFWNWIYTFHGNGEVSGKRRH